MTTAGTGAGPLLLGAPSKGRLQEQVQNFLADCGMAPVKSQGARGYAAHISALPGAEIRLMSAGEIARALRDGEIHVGITGEDLLRELDPDLARVILVKPLGFGRADVVVAAPQSWIDVDTMGDLEAVCDAFRARTGRRLRVATKYLSLASHFFEARGLQDYRLVESLGATEGAPAAGAAEIIVDITTTGQTLAANHLKPLADGLILKSEAQLAASRAADWSGPTQATFARFLDAAEARARAKALRVLRVDPGAAAASTLREIAVGEGCRAVGEGAPGALELHCPAGAVLGACAALQAAGAGRIAVLTPDYLFELPNQIFEAFRARLGERS